MHFNIKDKNFVEPLLTNIKVDNKLEDLKIEYGFNELLNNQRNKIDKINHNEWKAARFYINDYDFLVKPPIINRAFYKFWEIINEFEIYENFTEDSIIFHCAEAPGGFIQASNIFLQLDNSDYTKSKQSKPEKDLDGFTIVKSKKKEYKKSKIFTISLNKDLPKYKSYNLPSYNKSVINKNVHITYGKDNTGDINNLENIYYIKELINRQKSDGFNLITSDLGFDEGIEFNNKEQLHCLAITNCIFNTVYLQKEGGHYVLKVFDIFTETSIQLLYLLNTLYDEVYIYKPKTSRPSNSEKYIICKGFTKNKEYKQKVIDTLLLTITEINKVKGSNKYISFKLFEFIPESFTKKIKETNTRLVNIQCQFLNKAIQLCEYPNFLINYEKQLPFLINKRKQIFKEWEALYNLNVFI
jgi:23S rRNA U2552 (ribose-2'-O)-methylase RlmE/FtsJ